MGSKCVCFCTIHYYRNCIKLRKYFLRRRQHDWRRTVERFLQENDRSGFPKHRSWNAMGRKQLPICRGRSIFKLAPIDASRRVQTRQIVLEIFQPKKNPKAKTALDREAMLGWTPARATFGGRPARSDRQRGWGGVARLVHRAPLFARLQTYPEGSGGTVRFLIVLFGGNVDRRILITGEGTLPGLARKHSSSARETPPPARQYPAKRAFITFGGLEAGCRFSG